MASVAELFPSGNDPSLLVARIAFLQREIDSLNHDVIKQARLFYRCGRLEAEFGRHDKAVDDFKEARDRYIAGEGEEGLNAFQNELMLIEIRLHRSQQALDRS